MVKLTVSSSLWGPVKVYDFKEQLAKGNAGELKFLAAYPDLTRLDGRKGDFIGFSGRTIELKTDSRTTRESPNFFMEYCRNEATQAPGGPWQALDNEVFYFVYLFKDGIIYWFETEALVKCLTSRRNDYQTRKIFNKGWTATGFLVPRASLEALIIKKENIDELIKRSGS